MANRDSSVKAGSRPLLLVGSALALVLGLGALGIQGFRLASGAITYEGSVVSFVGASMFATMGAMGLALALRRR